MASVTRKSVELEAVMIDTELDAQIESQTRGLKPRAAGTVPPPPPKRAAVSSDIANQTSGQIDIGALADAWRSKRGEAAKRDSVEMIAIAPADLLMPSATTEEASGGMPYGWVAALSLALVMVSASVSAAVTYVVMRNDNPAPAVAQPVVLTEPMVVEAAPEPAPVVAPAIVAEEPEPVVAPEPELAVAAEPVVAPASTPAREERRARRERAGEEEPAVEAEPEIAPEPEPEVAPEPEPVAVAPAPAPGATCDEVACLVEPEADPCCAKFQPKTKPAAEKADPAAALPETLAAGDVTDGLRTARGRLLSCGDRHGFEGVAQLRLNIAADGSVLSVKTAQGNAEFQACVENVASNVTFRKTQRGATITYPVVYK